MKLPAVPKRLTFVKSDQNIVDIQIWEGQGLIQPATCAKSQKRSDCIQYKMKYEYQFVNINENDYIYIFGFALFHNLRFITTFVTFI